MTPEHINTVLLGLVGFFLHRLIRKIDEIDVSAKMIVTDVALIKQDRQLIWDKIEEMESDLEELKRLVRASNG
jgi:hypothetical protein